MSLERQTEEQLIGKLQRLKSEYRHDICDRDGLVKNFREKFQSPNRVQLGNSERVPGFIIIGLRRHPSATTGFPTAIKSLVAVRHVDPPKPWGEGPENESLADEVLDELHRQDLISSAQRDYYSGLCTRAEARAARLSDDPAVRATSIIRLFTSDDERITRAIRVAVTSQSTRKRVTDKLCIELATALILRANTDDPAKADQIRRYLRESFGKAAQRGDWESTDRTNELLAAEALKEVRQAITSDRPMDPGPASLELAVRAAYPLVVSGRLAADRGTANNAQPDRRNPGEVIDAMRRTIQGVHQLTQSLNDFTSNKSLRAVDENGNIKTLSDGHGELMINDIYLRGEFPPPGKARAPRPGATPHDLLHNAIGTFTTAMEQLDHAYMGIAGVLGNDGRPLVEDLGVDTQLCTTWREALAGITDDLGYWSRRFKQANGLKADASRLKQTDEPEEDVEADEDLEESEATASRS
jgi:hypothetical protein